MTELDNEDDSESIDSNIELNVASTSLASIPSLEIPSTQNITITIDDESRKVQFMIDQLLAMSDNFLTNAHKLVVGTCNKSGLITYNNMIELSIKALLMILSKYNRHLNPALESTICLRLATIVFEETLSLELADTYVNRAIDISTRNNLLGIRFEGESLQARILQRSNMNMVTLYLQDKISFYESMGIPEFSIWFQFLKVYHLLNVDVSAGLIALHNLLSIPMLHPILRSYGLMFEANLHLLRGSPHQALQHLQYVDNISIKQLQAMKLLTTFNAYIQCNDSTNGKLIMNELSTFVMKEQNNKWKGWKDNGTFSFMIKVESINTEYSHTIEWIGADEFIIIFYYLTGIHLLSEAANGKKKAYKVFSKCQQIISQQLKELTFLNSEFPTGSKRKLSIGQLDHKIRKLKYIQYNIDYYKAWIGFLNSEFKDIKYLNQFMTDFNGCQHDNEDQLIFDALLPKVYFMFAIYYQSMGDLQVAKYHYMKVINLVSDKSKLNLNLNLNLKLNIPVEIHDMNFGISNISMRGNNEFNDLYVYSNLHLLILIQFEIRQVTNHDKIQIYHSLSSHILQNLTKCFTPRTTSNEFTSNFISSNELLNITYRLILSIFNDQLPSNLLLQDIIKCVEKISIDSCYPFITNLMNYIAYISATDVYHKNKFFEKCLSVMSNSSGTDNDKTLSIFILRSLIEHFRSTGENDKANMAELQCQYFCNGLSDKFKFLFNNIDQT
ncbi:cohesin loading factor [Scheffersomyces amazonensis]|uniref:cohesin loading factor n=1 Tax=Scheffersomyces amazonensis TaxID=1078765 RepID=UPI00315D1FE7